MRKKIDVQHLRLGMYVCELDRPWIESRFVFQGAFEIRTYEQLKELARVCKYVYIETDIEYEDGEARPRRSAPVSAPIPDELATKRTSYEILDKFAGPSTVPPRYPDRVSVEEELPRARELVRDTKTLIDSTLDDVRLGRSLDTGTAKRAVLNMVQSVLRNPDALVWFNQLKNKDVYTAEHSLRVCVLALTFGRHLGLSEPKLNILGMGALLHDIGKMKIPADILNKPGRLTAEEFDLMKSHVPRGVDILESTPGIPAAAIDVARLHHERYDGNGYAFGLKGDRIALFGQIGAIADTYDAITSDRSYHRGMSAHDALRKMYEWRRAAFHGKLVEQFIQCMGIYPIGSIVEMNTGCIGVVVSVNRTRRLRPRIALVLDAAKRRYASPRIIDLMNEDTHGPAAVVIRKVLPANSFGINPLDYLPIAG